MGKEGKENSLRHDCCFCCCYFLLTLNARTILRSLVEAPSTSVVMTRNKVRIT